MERILGPAPALPVAPATPIGTPAPVPPASAPDNTPPKSSFERRLAGPAFAKVSKEQDGSASTVSLSQSAAPAAFSASRTRMGDEAGSGSVVISPSTSTDVVTEIPRGTLNIPPTVSKSQADPNQVLVARDVDFRSVYALRVANSPSPPEGNP